MCAIVGPDLVVDEPLMPLDVKFAFGVKVIDGVCGRNLPGRSCDLNSDKIVLVCLSRAVGKVGCAFCVIGRVWTSMSGYPGMRAG